MSADCATVTADGGVTEMDGVYIVFNGIFGMVQIGIFDVFAVGAVSAC